MMKEARRASCAQRHRAVARLNDFYSDFDIYISHHVEGCVNFKEDYRDVNDGQAPL